jgi:hypothetical protein
LGVSRKSKWEYLEVSIEGDEDPTRDAETEKRVSATTRGCGHAR